MRVDARRQYDRAMIVEVDFSNIERVRRNWKYTGPRQDEWSSVIADFGIFGYRNI